MSGMVYTETLGQNTNNIVIVNMHIMKASTSDCDCFWRVPSKEWLINMIWLWLTILQSVWLTSNNMKFEYSRENSVSTRKRDHRTHVYFLGRVTGKASHEADLPTLIMNIWYSDSEKNEFLLFQKYSLEGKAQQVEFKTQWKYSSIEWIMWKQNVRNRQKESN